MNTINFQQICNALLLVMIIIITLQFTSSKIFSTLLINKKYLPLKLGSYLNMLKNELNYTILENDNILNCEDFNESFLIQLNMIKSFLKNEFDLDLLTPTVIKKSSIVFLN